MPIPQDMHRLRTGLLARAADALVILLALRVGVGWRGIAWTDRYTIAGVLAVLLFYVFGESVRLNRPWRGASPRQYLWPVLAAWLWTGFALFALAWIMKTTGDYSRIAVGLWMIFGLFGLVAWRVAARAVLGMVRAHGRDTRRVAVAGIGDRGRQLARLLRSTPSFGLTLAGFFADPEDEADRPEALPAPRLGDLASLVERARAGEFDVVYVALPLKAEERVKALVLALSDTRAATYVVPDLFVHDLAHSRWTDVGPIPVINVFEAPFAGIDGWIKRVEDVVLSLLVLAAAAVPMLAIAVAVKCGSPGPVLFRQRRSGLDGRAITVWKFRTMTVQEDGDDVTLVVRGDPRVTPIGAFLRRTSLDELPQFLNVLGGDMSIVGPRPHALAVAEGYRRLVPGYMLRHRVKPGITGWAQIHGWRGPTDRVEQIERRVQFDLWYIRNWSLWLDLWIIARTALRGFVGGNAY